MKTSHILTSLAVLGLLGAGCASQQGNSTVEQETAKGASSSQESVLALSECQPVNDGYQYDANDRYGWQDHIMKFPVSDTYQALKPFSGETGELDLAIAARAFTAADCGGDRLKELMGGDTSQDIAFFNMSFDTASKPTDEFSAVINGPEFSCEKLDDTGRTSCTLQSNSLETLLKLKPYADQISNIVEY